MVYAFCVYVRTKFPLHDSASIADFTFSGFAPIFILIFNALLAHYRKIEFLDQIEMDAIDRIRRFL